MWQFKFTGNNSLLPTWQTFIYHNYIINHKRSNFFQFIVPVYAWTFCYCIAAFPTETRNRITSYILYFLLRALYNFFERCVRSLCRMTPLHISPLTGSKLVPLVSRLPLLMYVKSYVQWILQGVVVKVLLQGKCFQVQSNLY